MSLLCNVLTIVMDLPFSLAAIRSPIFPNISSINQVGNWQAGSPCPNLTEDLPCHTIPHVCQTQLQTLFIRTRLSAFRVQDQVNASRAGAADAAAAAALTFQLTFGVCKLFVKVFVS